MPEVTKTNDFPKFGREDIHGTIRAIYHNKKFLSSTKEVPEGEQLGLILDRTNFYAEQGGQEYDTGKLLIDGVAEIDVQNVQVYAGYVLHTGYMNYGAFNTGDDVLCEYDELRRHPIRNNHTGTHILNFALREVLGNEVNQRGSLVAPEKLRFDFSHKAGLSDKELVAVEDKATSYIRQNSQVYALDVPLATARHIEGVRAVFGETYPDPVRVVSVGVPVEELLENVKNPEWRNVSVEFCGGTHVDNTREIKELIIVEESGIAKGIRRIIAVTGSTAHEVQRVAADFEEEIKALEKMKYSADKDARCKQTQVQLNQLDISTITKAKLRDRFAKILKENLDHQKSLLKQETKTLVDAVSTHFTSNPTSSAAILHIPSVSANSKSLSEALKLLSSPKTSLAKEHKDKPVYLLLADPVHSSSSSSAEGHEARDNGGKVVHGCYVPENLRTRGVDANTWANRVADVVGGKAGGKGATCLGQGSKVESVDEAVEEARKWFDGLGV